MKRIVVCCDGTWNDRFEGTKTNVMRIAHSVRPTALDGTTQITEYISGVGSEWSMMARLSGGAFGAGLSKNVQDAYQFIVDNYDDGDQLYFFGFSRGAFTVRSTAGLIRKCGLLRKEYGHLAAEAYGIYRHRDNDKDPRKRGVDSQVAMEFRDKYSRRIPIDFMGVWDTVGSLGMPIVGLRSWIAAKRWRFHDQRLSRSVKNAYHALAIDERRRPFGPSVWEYHAAPGQRVEQVWFTGVHSDIGGSFKETGLSDITFQWMQDKAEGVGLAFSSDALGFAGVAPEPNEFAFLHNSMSLPFRLLIPSPRKIGGPPQQVHITAKRRYQRESFDYGPKNLMHYFRRFPEEQYWAEQYADRTPPPEQYAEGYVPSPPRPVDEPRELEDAALG